MSLCKDLNLSPLPRSWRRLVRKRIGADQIRVDICYITPSGRRLRTFPEIQRHLDMGQQTNLTIDHFTFSKKVAVGELLDGPLVSTWSGREGVTWVKVAVGELLDGPLVSTWSGRRGYMAVSELLGGPLVSVGGEGLHMELGSYTLWPVKWLDNRIHNIMFTECSVFVDGRSS